MTVLTVMVLAPGATARASGPVETEPAVSVTPTSATLKGNVNPEGAEVTECKFDYGTTTSYESTAPCTTLPGSGEVRVPVSAAVTGLAPKTKYHFRLSATNGSGTRRGSDRTFTTLPIRPVAVTEPATAVTQASATLQGMVNPEGETVTACLFEYGTTEG